MSNLLGNLLSSLGGGKDRGQTITAQKEIQEYERNRLGNELDKREGLELTLSKDIQSLYTAVENKPEEQADALIADYTNGGYNSLKAFETGISGTYGPQAFIGMYGIGGAAKKLDFLWNSSELNDAYMPDKRGKFDIAKSTVGFDSNGQMIFTPFIDLGDGTSAAITKDGSKNIDNLNEGGVELANSRLLDDSTFLKLNSAYREYYDNQGYNLGLSPEVNTERPIATRNNDPIGTSDTFDNMLATLPEPETNDGVKNPPQEKSVTTSAGDYVGPTNKISMQESSNNSDALWKNSETDTFKNQKPVTEQNLAEVLEFVKIDGEYANWSKTQNNPATDGAGDIHTPVGKYQFVGATLRDIKTRGGFEELGITDDTVFSEETQDKLFSWYIKDTIQAAETEGTDPKTKIRGRFEGIATTDDMSDKELDTVIQQVQDGTYATGPTQSDDSNLIPGTLLPLLNPNEPLKFKTGDENVESYMSQMSGSEVATFIKNGEVPKRFIDSSIPKDTSQRPDQIFKNKKGDDGKISFKKGKYFFAQDSESTTDPLRPARPTGTTNFEPVEITKEDANAAGYFNPKDTALARKENTEALDKIIPKTNEALITQIKAAAAAGDTNALQSLLEQGTTNETLSPANQKAIVDLLKKRKNNLFTFTEAQQIQTFQAIYNSIPKEDRTPAILQLMGQGISEGKMPFFDRQAELNFKEKKLAFDNRDNIEYKNYDSVISSITTSVSEAGNILAFDGDDNTIDITDVLATAIDNTSSIIPNLMRRSIEEGRKADNLIEVEQTNKTIINKWMKELAENKGWYFGIGKNLGDFAQYLGLKDPDATAVAGALTSNMIGTDRDGIVQVDPKFITHFRFVDQGSLFREGEPISSGQLLGAGGSKKGLPASLVKQLTIQAALNSYNYNERAGAYNNTGG